MSINAKIKAIKNKIEQNKAQCNLDRQTAKISALSALSSGNVSKYEFCLAKMFYQKKNLLENAATMERVK